MSQTVFYAFRMDYVRDSDRQRLSDWLSANFDSFLVVSEVVEGENPHVHGLLASTKKLDALRKSFKRAFEEKRGNGAYSLKECSEDPAGFMRYICKGQSVDDDPVVEFRQGVDYDEESVQAAHEEFYSAQAAHKRAARERAEFKGNMVEAVEKICREEGVRAYDRKGIARVYIRQMKVLRRPINIFHARSVVNGVVVALDEEDSGASEDIVTAIANI